MEQPYQETMKDWQHSDIHTNLAQTTAPAMPISDEACMLLDKTSVKSAESKDASGVNWCIRKELIKRMLWIFVLCCFVFASIPLMYN